MCRLCRARMFPVELEQSDALSSYFSSYTTVSVLYLWYVVLCHAKSIQSRLTLRTMSCVSPPGPLLLFMGQRKNTPGKNVSGLPCLPPGNLQIQGSNPHLLQLHTVGGFFPGEPLGSPCDIFSAKYFFHSVLFLGDLAILNSPQHSSAVLSSASKCSTTVMCLTGKLQIW